MKTVGLLLTSAALACSALFIQTIRPVSAAEPAQQVTESDNGKTVSVAQGANLEIRLDGNPTTGYIWKVTGVSGQAVKQVGKVDYVAAAHAAGLVGSGGTFIARFTADKAGTSTVKMDYARPWEREKPPAKTFTANIAVTNN